MVAILCYLVVSANRQAGHMGDHSVYTFLLVDPLYADFISELHTVNGAKITRTLTTVTVIFFAFAPVPVQKVGADGYGKRISHLNPP
jgi:hypothetical protein